MEEILWVLEYFFDFLEKDKRGQRLRLLRDGQCESLLVLLVVSMFEI